MNKKAMLVIFISLNLFALAIDTLLGGVFFCLWVWWYAQNIGRLDP